MIDTSQNGETTIIAGYFGRKVGTFLSLGENNGIHLSNVRGLVMEGWKGVCVEASRKVFEELVVNMAFDGIQCINVAVGVENGPVTLMESNEHLGRGDWGLLSTIKESEVERWKGTQEFTPVQTDCVTFDKLLEMCRYKKFDLVSCDIEGMDYDVLEQMNFKEMGVKCVVVEFNNDKQEQFDSLMLPLGYRLLHKNYENLVYAL